jgi:type I restriction enzyme S subunit
MTSTFTEQPQSWAYPQISEVCDILAGYGFPTRLQGKAEGELPFFKVGDISAAWKRNEVYLIRANHHLSYQEAKSIKADPIPPGTTVFAKIGAAIALNRRAILAQPSLVDNNVMGLYPSPIGLNSKYLFYFTCTLELDEFSRATTVPSLRRSDVETIKIPLPPIPEQSRIVSEIEKHFTRLDAAVGALKRIQANLKRYRASVLKAACEGRLVPTEAELAKAEGRDYEPADLLLSLILKERRAKWEADQLAKMKAQGKTPKDNKWKAKYEEFTTPDLVSLPAPPEGWAWSSVEAISSVIVDCPHSTPSWTIEGRICVRTTNFRAGYLDLTEVRYVSESTYQERIERLEPRPGDILYSREGGILGIACTVPPNVSLCLGQRMMLLRTHDDLLSHYLMHLLNSTIVLAQVRRLTSGSASPHLNVGDVKRFLVPLPPTEEQHRIVAEVERHISIIEELETVVEANLKRAERLRQSILKRAFEGKLVPQDPTDEPASNLLERIRAERGKKPSKEKVQRNKRRAGKSTQPELDWQTPEENIASTKAQTNS